MFLEEYGFIIEIVDDKQNISYRHLQDYYSAWDCLEDGGIVILKHNGNGLADVADIWAEDYSPDDEIAFGLDAHQPLIRGYENRPNSQIMVQAQDNLIPILTDWVEELLVRNEMPDLAKTLRKACKQKITAFG